MGNLLTQACRYAAKCAASMRGEADALNRRASAGSFKYMYIYMYKYNNEVGCKDDTMPKAVDTKMHHKGVESMQQSSTTPKN